MHFIGITGGVGAGKSEILAYIRKKYRCEIYLADEVAHLVKQPGTQAYQELLGLLGGDIVDQNRQIDRQVMADRIFGHAELLEKVNGIIHPAVKKFLLERLEEARAAGRVDLFFVEAALLIEGGYLNLVDENAFWMRQSEGTGLRAPGATAEIKFPRLWPDSSQRKSSGNAVIL